jgi:hypothetical protein
VATHLAAISADQLVESYPDAKVILIQRNYDKWWASFQTQDLDALVSPSAKPVVSIADALAGARAMEVMQKTLFGAFDTHDVKGIKQNSRKTYFAYYDWFREIVPPGNRPEHRLG